jgi:hypothetical protein
MKNTKKSWFRAGRSSATGQVVAVKQIACGGDAAGIEEVIHLSSWHPMRQELPNYAGVEVPLSVRWETRSIPDRVGVGRMSQNGELLRLHS